MARQKAAKRNTKDFQLISLDVEKKFMPDIKKKFSLHDLKHISPMTENQRAAFDLWEDPETTVLGLLGYAGTGKSFLACYLALKEVLDPSTPYKKIVIIKSTVECRSLGSLPGEIEDKVSPFKEPYRYIFDELLSYKKSFQNMEEIGLVEFMPTSYLRGISFNDSIVIFEECQDNTFIEAETVLTRLGENSKMLITGDENQNDLGSRSGFYGILPILRRTDGTAFVDFGLEDIVRSGWVKNYLLAKYRK